MLRAIGIYEINESKGTVEFKKTQYVPNDKGLLGLFPPNYLEDFEKETLPIFSSESEMKRVYGFKNLPIWRMVGHEIRIENHYCQRNFKNQLIVIVSRQKLEMKEYRRLFSNIDHAVNSPMSKTTLDDILMNPMGYISKDLKISEINDKTDDLKMTLFENIDRLKERGERLEVIDAKAIRLQEESKTFKKEATKLNSCCRGW